MIQTMMIMTSALARHRGCKSVAKVSSSAPIQLYKYLTSGLIVNMFVSTL